MDETPSMDPPGGKIESAASNCRAGGPAPAEIALIAAHLAAKSSKKISDLFGDAYDLWHSADSHIRKRQALEQEAARKQFAQQAEAVMFPKRLLSFREVIEKGMVPKNIGGKGRQLGTAAVLGDRGFIKSLTLFFEQSHPLPPLQEEIETLEGELTQGRRNAGSRLFLKRILRERQIPQETLEAFKEWRSRRLRTKR